MPRDTPLEKTVENRSCSIMRKQYQFWAIKLNLMGQRGMPDRLVLGKNRMIFFIEFKRKGKKPTALQASIHDVLRVFGFNVYVVDDWRDIDGICKEERDMAAA